MGTKIVNMALGAIAFVFSAALIVLAGVVFIGRSIINLLKN